ncbi:MAG: hypothetical protein KDB27_35070 [Planctomycetales bacterium]|nr:hypothetical protein [Planctomycetales bacterium]
MAGSAVRTHARDLPATWESVQKHPQDVQLPEATGMSGVSMLGDLRRWCEREHRKLSDHVSPLILEARWASTHDGGKRH